jgi:Glycosyl transferases group 1
LHLEIDRWLIPSHSTLPTGNRSTPSVRRDIVEVPLDDQQLKAWLHGLDWIVFVELPHFDNLVRVAAHFGVGVACVANWEWLHPHLDWLPFVDLMICPTRHTLLVLNDWKRRYGFGWDAIYVPWPIDVNRFPFRQRERCGRFLYVNGWGGAPLRRLDGSDAPYRRKGFELIVAAAWLAPHLSFIVHSQEQQKTKLPPNIELRAGPYDNVALYREGDVCVQPSHFEGLGLPLLECQAAGLPLVTTDAPPMNEHQPLRKIPVRGSEIVCVGGGPISSQIMNPSDLVSTLEPLVGADIRSASLGARQFVVREHSWAFAVQQLRDAMTKR